MNPLRVVLDTNILVSALLFRQGSLHWIRHAWHSGAIAPLVSRATTAELLRVLQYPKFRLIAEDREHLLGDYLPYCEVVDATRVKGIPQCRDPFDRPFLALALAGRADVLVTGDRDLLTIGQRFPVPIVTASDLRGRLRAAQGD